MRRIEPVSCCSASQTVARQRTRSPESVIRRTAQQDCPRNNAACGSKRKMHWEENARTMSKEEKVQKAVTVVGRKKFFKASYCGFSMYFDSTTWTLLQGPQKETNITGALVHTSVVYRLFDEQDYPVSRYNSLQRQVWSVVIYSMWSVHEHRKPKPWCQMCTVRGEKGQNDKAAQQVSTNCTHILRVQSRTMIIEEPTLNF